MVRYSDANIVKMVYGEKRLAISSSPSGSSTDAEDDGSMERFKTGAVLDLGREEEEALDEEDVVDAFGWSGDVAGRKSHSSCRGAIRN